MTYTEGVITYELWDTNSFNLIDDFESESAALEAAHQLITRNRDVYPEGLALARGSEHETVWLARGAELQERIERAMASDGTTSGSPHIRRDVVAQAPGDHVKIRRSATPERRRPPRTAAERAKDRSSDVRPG